MRLSESMYWLVSLGNQSVDFRSRWKVERMGACPLIFVIQSDNAGISKNSDHPSAGS